MKHFVENKDRFIDRNANLTYEQAQEIKNFFNAHTNAENIIDWNTSDRLTYDDFKNAIDTYNHRNTNANADRIANKVGLSGIVLNQDYLDLGEYTADYFGTFHAYSPLTHLGAKTIAGPQVPPVRKDKDSASWCIGYSGNDTYWNDYCSEDHDDYFVILCGEKIPTFKICLEVSSYTDTEHVTVWDYYDKSIYLYKFFEKYECSEKDEEIIYNLISYAKEQGAYDKRVFTDIYSLPSLDVIEQMVENASAKYVKAWGKDVVDAYRNANNEITSNYEMYIELCTEDNTTRDIVIYDMNHMIEDYFNKIDSSLMGNIYNYDDFLNYLSEYDSEQFFSQFIYQLHGAQVEGDFPTVMDKLTEIKEKYKNNVKVRIDKTSEFEAFRRTIYNLDPNTRIEACNEIQDYFLHDKDAQYLIECYLLTDYTTEDCESPFVTNEEKTVFFWADDMWYFRRDWLYRE